MTPRACAALATMAVAALVLAACAGAEASPRSGEHWHASYLVSICGREQPLVPEVDGGIHTHGDGVIHVHPRDASEEGKAARLVEFFRSAGGDLSEGSLQLPDDRPWGNGDVCPEGRRGRVVVVVNQDPLKEGVESYIPQDGDRILIAFVPDGSIIPSVPAPPVPADD